MGIGFNDLTLMLGKRNQGNGRDGKSAYEIAVSHGFAGSETEWLASLKALPYTLTENDKTLIVAQVIESLGGNPIFGYVDEDNNIIVQGDLTDGTYSVKYELADGSTVDIGNLVLDTNTYWSVTKNLTNCVLDNSATKVVAGGSYSAKVTANDGYELSTVTVTMGGSAVSVSGGSISIASVTGDIVITAVATAVQTGPSYTNLLPISTDASGNPYNGGQGWKTGYRLNSSGVEVALANIEVTGFMPLKLNDTVYIKNITDDGTHVMALYDSAYAKLATMQFSTVFGVCNGELASKKINAALHTQVEQAGDKIAFMRISANEITANSIITVNETIA